MSQPPPAHGGGSPIWSRGDWWQKQPDGSYRRWSAFQEQWIEAEPHASIERGRSPVPHSWWYQRAPIVAAIALPYVFLIRMFFRGSTPAMTLVFVLWTVAFGAVIAWLLARP